MNFHTNLRALVGVSIVVFLVLSLLIAVMPAVEMQSVEPLAGAPIPSDVEQRGRQIYLNEGCGTCHTQFVRDLPVDKAYGRGSVAADYAREQPPLLGTQRTGPDLSNLGLRQPSEIWNLIHLYNPRAVVPESAMPAYPWYFELKDEAAKDDVVVPVPGKYVAKGKKVVANSDAIALVRYLQSLKQTEIKP